MITLAVIALTPLVYLMLGAPWLMLAGADRVRLNMAALLGGAIAGLASEVATMLSASAAAVALIALAFSAAATLWLTVQGHGGAFRRLIGDTYLLYLAALAAMAVSPFPTIGRWGGDWLFLYHTGRVTFEGGVMAWADLLRPPLFGGAVAPLWLLDDGLIPFQVFAAVMSAGALGAVRYASERISSQWWIAVALVALSAFFLHNTANCWAKLMAGGFILAALVDAGRNEPGRMPGAWPALWLALAVASHQSSIIYAPLVFAITAGQVGWRPAPTATRLAVFAVTGVLLVGVYEAWTVAAYGLQAKLAANAPALGRDPAVPLWLNSARIALTSLVGWSPAEAAIRWLQAPDKLSAARMAKEGFWFLTAWVEVMAGTLLGVILPLLIAGGVRRFRELWRRWAQGPRLTWALGLLLAIVLNAILNPFPSSSGTLQTGLVPVGLLALVAGASWIETQPRSRLRLAIGASLALSTLPWLVMNLGVATGIHLSAGFREAFVAGSEGDWARLQSNHLIPLGLAYFPWLPAVLLAACGALVVARSRSRASMLAASA